MKKNEKQRFVPGDLVRERPLSNDIDDISSVSFWFITKAYYAESIPGWPTPGWIYSAFDITDQEKRIEYSFRDINGWTYEKVQ